MHRHDMSLLPPPWPREVAPRPSPQPAEEFWAAFAARAAHVPQDAVQPKLVPRVSACLALAVAVLLLWFGPWWTPAIGSVGILQLEVPVEHEGVLVLQSPDVPGVVVVLDGVRADP